MRWDERFRDVPAVTAAFDCYFLDLVGYHFVLVCEFQVGIYGIVHRAGYYI